MVKKDYCKFFLIWTIFCLFTYLSGCAPKRVIVSKPTVKTVEQLQQKAESAWKNMDYARAEHLYQTLLQRKGLSSQEQQIAWKRLAFSSLSNGHFELTQKSLQNWSEMDVQARKKWDWYRIKARMYKQQGQMGDFESTLMEAIRRKASPWSLKVKATHFLTSFFRKEHLYKKAWHVQEVLFEEAGTNRQKKQLLRDFYQGLDPSSSKEWTMIQTSYATDLIYHFPYALLEWKATTYFLSKEDISWPQAWQRLQDILKNSTPLIKGFLKEKFSPLLEDYGSPVRTVAILIPLSGSYAKMSWDILRGIDIAQRESWHLGELIQVQVINTSSDTWTEYLKALPEHCNIVGGPLRKSVWQKIYDLDIQKERTFFAFTSRLDPGKEGQDGFRFFPSRSDQVRPLIQTMVNEFGVTDFAVMYPESSYGRSMLNVFQKELKNYQADLKGITNYNNQEPTGWQDRVADFLDIPEGYFESDNKKNKKQTQPDPKFQALFLPDSFGNAQIMIPEFYFFDVDHLFFLGPALWSQEIRHVSKLDSKYFDLALMPGMWWTDNPGPSLNRLNKGLDETVQGQANFWVGLGYDFLRWSMELLNRDFSEKGFGSRCQILGSLASDFQWTMAPIYWDSKGRASQDLFLLQPGEQGVVHADLDKIWSIFMSRQGNRSLDN